MPSATTGSPTATRLHEQNDRGQPCSGEIATAGQKKVTVELTRKAKRAFSRLHTVAPAVRVSTTDAAGNVSKTSRKLTLKR